MKCPLLRLAEIAAGSPYFTDVSDCLRENCAVWSGSGEACSVVELSKLLGALGMVVSEALENRGEVRHR